LILAPVIFITL